MSIPDMYVFIYGLFHEQLAFARAGMIHLDCHSGNQLVSMDGDNIAFSWSDFGYSLLYLDSKHFSFTNTHMYNAASKNMFIHLLYKANLTKYQPLMLHIKELQTLHSDLSKADAVQLFTNMSEKAQEIIHSLEYPLMLEVVQRAGSAVKGTLNNMDSRLTRVEDELRTQKKYFEDELRTQNETLKFQNKVIKDLQDRLEKAGF